MLGAEKEKEGYCHFRRSWFKKGNKARFGKRLFFHVYFESFKFLMNVEIDLLYISLIIYAIIVL